MASSAPAPKPASRPRKRVRLLYEHRVNLYCFLVALPGLVVSTILIWMQSWTLESRLALIALELFLWWILALALQEQTTRPLQTLANVIGALREEDYSFRARNAVAEDALGELSLEVNALADMLSDEKIRTIEATALLQRVVDEIDAPLFAFDPASVLRLVNPAGAHLLRQSPARMLGRSAADLHLQKCLDADNESLVELDLNLNDSQARWLLRRSSFRQNGVPHTLVVLSDVSRALREEERRAWQRLIRVLGHELSNSLAPIKSIAGSLNSRVSSTDMDTDVRHDLQHGLEIIEARSASLHRFLEAYRRLAQMPAPVLRDVDLANLVARVASLETRVKVCVQPSPAVLFVADPDQLEQMLINLVRNAADAVLEMTADSAKHSVPGAALKSSDGDGKVRVRWDVSDVDVSVLVEDNGPGLSNPANVFTPFYTTKPGGSGVGLVLSRQIAEAHGGRIEISNRNGERGCLVRVVLPRAPQQQR
ncbi:MAG TPA: ATP-binding protein [Candidatus Sulfotelmatobacter sp.]|jgi:nitrogen fixation/metabolism regulation signal transduction histidine kinase|nr:ATP-binding protein [Candidatus Sulfotelmatobacter sp.]